MNNENLLSQTHSAPPAIVSREEPLFDLHEFFWNCACDNSREAMHMVREHIAQKHISKSDLKKLTSFLCRHGDPKVGLRLVPKCKGYHFRSIQRHIAYARLGWSRQRIKYTLISHALTARKNPRRLANTALNKLQLASKQLLCWKSQSAHRAALNEYPRVLERLSRLVEGQRILLLGSGPSAAAVRSIPDDVIVFCVNRSVIQLKHVRSRGKKLVWLIGGAMGTRYWHHAQSLTEDVGHVDWVLLEFFREWWRHSWGPRQWQSLLANWPFRDKTSYLRIDDLKWWPTCMKNMKRHPSIRLSNGINILKYIIGMSPAEVYLAGIDLGYAGREDGPHAYFYDEKMFYDNDGSILRSRQLQNHPMDEPFVRDIGLSNLPVFSASPNSKAADYLSVKELK